MSTLDKNVCNSCFNNILKAVLLPLYTDYTGVGALYFYAFFSYKVLSVLSYEFWIYSTWTNQENTDLQSF